MSRRQRSFSSVVAAAGGLLLTFVLALVGGDPELIRTLSVPTVLGLLLCAFILMGRRPGAPASPHQDAPGASPYRDRALDAAEQDEASDPAEPEKRWWRSWLLWAAVLILVVLASAAVFRVLYTLALLGIG
jgi:hypothetical protein